MTYANYYEAVSNRLLWVANHGLWDELGDGQSRGDEIAAWLHGYERVNADVAEAVASAAAEDDVVTFQDYHLATAPAHLRALRRHQAIAHFTHTPFASPASLAHLPPQVAEELIRGMAGADLIGFHTADWCEAFLDCCERYGIETDRGSGTLNCHGRSAWVRAYPLPIDVEVVRERAFAAPAEEWARRFAGLRSGPLVVRVDRVDPAKNVVRGFEAFRMVLDRRPDLRSARFVACLYGTRQSMPEYRRYAEWIREAAAEVNTSHPEAIVLFMEESYDRALGALRNYDVLIVNPVADGMNLVAKEGPAVNEHAGALVLSRGAGAFAELGDGAVAIGDPHSVEETADALERALDMPPTERERNAALLRATVEGLTPADWFAAQLEDLREIVANRPPTAPPPTT
jgi:trehalose 6-phosphate synthase